MVDEKLNGQQEMIIEEALVGQPHYMSRSDNGVRDCPELFYADMVPRLSQVTRQQRRKPNIGRRKEGAALSIFIIPNRPKYTNVVKRGPAVLHASTDTALPRLVTALAVENYR